MNHGPPHKKSRGDHHQFGHGAGYDDFPNLREFLERKDEKLPPNHILLITVLNAKYPINVEVMYKVCSIVGAIRRIVCFERNTVIQGMVEFETLESASKARSSLHGCDIYNNCCTMKVEYSKMESLKVRENGPMSWDFTQSLGPDIRDKGRPVILNDPDMPGDMGGRGGGDYRGQEFMSGMRSMEMMGGGHDTMMGGPGPSSMRGDDRSCVVIVHNLSMGEMNCDRLFNLVCQYGNVSKIFFMKTKPGCAMIEMGDHEGAQRLVTNIQGAFLFRNKLQLDLSKKHIRITNAPLEFKLDDGTNSVKDYVSDWRLNRFNTKEMARKNRILAPTKVVHFYGVAKDSREQDIEDLFAEYCAPTPTKVKFVESKKEREGSGADDRSGVGLAYFNSVEEATEALVMVNHRDVNSKMIKLCFSPATY